LWSWLLPIIFLQIITHDTRVSIQEHRNIRQQEEEEIESKIQAEVEKRLVELSEQAKSEG